MVATDAHASATESGLLITIIKHLQTMFRNILWIFPFISFIIGYQAIAWLYRVDSLDTPSIVGKPLPQALATLAQHNLNARFISFQETTDVAADTVMSQIPAPGTKIKPQQIVSLVIAKKPDAVITPQFLAKPINVCMQEAKKAGIILKTYAINSSLPSDMCIGQWPKQGTALQQKMVVIYKAANNQRLVIMPHLKNHTVPEVTAFLAQQSVTPIIVHRYRQDEAHQCTTDCIITDQRPAAGSLVNLNSPLSIYLYI